MDIAESIGFIHFWGFTPSYNLLNSPKATNDILLSGSGDIRHLMLTLSELSITTSESSLSFYIHEQSKEVLCRSLLLLYLINDTTLPIRERVELFLEIYGNTLIRERTAEYVSGAAQSLIKIVTGHKSAGALKEIFDFSCLKFKDRDDFEEIFVSWTAQAPFDMVGLRDQRLRYHYKERYDHQDNLADWDYHWNYKDLAPQISHRHYKSWRRTGVAYEYRLATYNSANKTLSGYIPGKKKVSKDSVLVRGFWGDIINSPYWAFGLDVNCCSACTEILNKIGNTDRVHHEGDISDFNLTKMIQQMETFAEYHFPPEKDKMRAIRKYWAGEEVKQEIEPSIDLVNTDAPYLPAFSRFKVKIVPVVEEFKTMATKRKFFEYFDRILLGSASNVDNLQAVKTMGKNDCLLIVETLNNIGIIPKEDRATADVKLKELAQEAGWAEESSSSNRIIFTKQ